MHISRHCETKTLNPKRHIKAAWKVVNGKASSTAAQQLSLLQLRTLDLNYNMLTGPLPSSWSSLKLVSMLLHAYAAAACAVPELAMMAPPCMSYKQHMPVDVVTEWSCHYLCQDAHVI